VASIIADLDANGLVETETKLSFNLSASEMVVNGKAVDKGLADVFRKKYIRSSGDSYQYQRDGGTTKTTINLE
jgi:hypothetical protein